MSQLGGYITVKKAAETYGLTRRRWRQLCDNGVIEAVKLGGLWFLKPESCEEYLKRKTNQPS